MIGGYIEYLSRMPPSVGSPSDDGSSNRSGLLLVVDPFYQSHREVAAIWQDLARSLSLVSFKQLEISSTFPKPRMIALSSPDQVYEGPFDYNAMLTWVLQMARLTRDRPSLTKTSICPDLIEYGTSSN
jgi:hypothetical protein